MAGDYTGNGGTLEIEAVLGGDASSTDRLVVNGSTAGNTQIAVLNRGGLGGLTAEGIKIVDVPGTSHGIFALDGGYVFAGDQAVMAGAYGYRLYQNSAEARGDGNGGAGKCRYGRYAEDYIKQKR